MAADAKSQYLARVRSALPFRAAVQDASEPAWAASEILATGALKGAELEGVGALRILQRGEERRVVLERFDVDYAPGLQLVLSRGLRPTRFEELQQTVSVGEIRGAFGQQVFELPSNVPLETLRSAALVAPRERVVVVSGELLHRR